MPDGSEPDARKPIDLVCHHRWTDPQMQRWQRNGEVALGVADEVLHDSFRWGIRGVVEVRGKSVVAGETDVVRGRDDDVCDEPTFEARHPVGEHLRRDPADRSKSSDDRRCCSGGFFIGGEQSESPS